MPIRAFYHIECDYWRCPAKTPSFRRRENLIDYAVEHGWCDRGAHWYCSKEHQREAEEEE